MASAPRHASPARMRESGATEDEQGNYIDESHIQAFARALAADEYGEPESPTVSTASYLDRDGRLSRHERIRKVSAVSDFAPISTKVKRRRSRPSQGKAQEWSYHLFRWPLLAVLLIFIFGEFELYVLIRQVVNLFEWLLAWRGRKRLLRKKLRKATTYEEWKEAATLMDEYLGFNDWKKEEEDPYYDWQLVKKVKRSLRSLREKGDMRGLMGVLEVCLRPNFAGTESSRLYSETFYGTKDLLEAYVNEVESSLAEFRNSRDVSVEEKRKFFRDVNRNLGSSALCLSGGATFGYYSFGVVKAFLDANLLPRVIAGTSAGGLIAALTCTRTDDELRKLLVPELADKITACEEPFPVWFRRFWRTGARFDTLEWARKACFFTRGSLTFREAYERTGRALNVSVIPFDQYSPTKLLNYLTAPDCVIWSAIIASAAVPGILNPVVLMQKTKDGSIVPWNWGSKFKDGSLRVDIPLQSLNLLFNVNHPIVSQVNPHVHLFFFAPRGSPGRPVAHRRGKGWRGGFFLSAAEQYLKLELTKNFKVIRDLELMPQLLGQDWSSVFLQRFDGSVTIWPKTRFMDWVHILTDPDRAELKHKLEVGQNVTWPKIHMIENRFRLEREILRGRLAVRQSTVSREREQPVPNVDERRPVPSFNLEQPSPDSSTAHESQRRRQIAIDSDAEKGFRTGAQQQPGARRPRPAPPAAGPSVQSFRSLPGTLRPKSAEASSDTIQLPSPSSPRYRKSGRGPSLRPPPFRANGGPRGSHSPSSPENSASVSDDEATASGKEKAPKSPSILSRSSSIISRLTPFASPFTFRSGPKSPSIKSKDKNGMPDGDMALASESSSDAETDIAWMAARAARTSPSISRRRSRDGEGMDPDMDS